MFDGSSAKVDTQFVVFHGQLVKVDIVCGLVQSTVRSAHLAFVRALVVSIRCQIMSAYQRRLPIFVFEN